AALPGRTPLAPTLDYIQRAHDDAKYGRPSADPILECTIPSVVDTTVAPPGKHVMSFFVQYAPYRLRNGTWDQEKDRFADRCFDILNEYAPNFKRAVIDRQVLSPLDLERRFGLTGGNIFQGAMTLSQLFFLRPLPGYADYRTPIKGLYLCGAATHPGGGVLGAWGNKGPREFWRAGNGGAKPRPVTVRRRSAGGRPPGQAGGGITGGGGGMGKLNLGGTARNPGRP